MEENFAEWVTKLDAAEQLGISERTLERTIQKQRIRTAQRRIPGRKPITVIHPSDFERLKRETIPATPNPPSEESTEPQSVPPLGSYKSFFSLADDSALPTQGAQPVDKRSLRVHRFLTGVSLTASQRREAPSH